MFDHIGSRVLADDLFQSGKGDDVPLYFIDYAKENVLEIDLFILCSYFC